MSLKGWIQDDDRGVSPVIGVILMVAITVILAAVIAAFVLDLGQSQSQNAQAGVEFSENGDLVKTQVVDEGNTDELYVQVAAGGSTAYLDGTDSTSTSTVDWGVGDSMEINSTALQNGDDLVGGTVNGVSAGDSVESITVIGVVDGEETVIQTWEP